MCRAHEGHFRPALSGDIGNFCIVCGYHHTVKTTTLHGCLNGPTYHRLAAKRLDVLARDALAASASRDNTDLHERFFGLMTRWGELPNTIESAGISVSFIIVLAAISTFAPI